MSLRAITENVWPTDGFVMEVMIHIFSCNISVFNSEFSPLFFFIENDCGDGSDESSARCGEFYNN
jgi:hypothetical protein